MKTYTISVDLFRELDETMSSIAFLEEQFPGLVNFQEYYSRSKPDWLKLKILETFNEILEGDSNTSRILHSVQYSSHGDLQEKLFEHLSINEDELENINIREALEKGYMVSRIAIIFSHDEKWLMLEAINYFAANSVDYKGAELLLLKEKLS